MRVRLALLSERSSRHARWGASTQKLLRSELDYLHHLCMQGLTWVTSCIDIHCISRTYGGRCCVRFRREGESRHGSACYHISNKLQLMYVCVSKFFTKNRDDAVENFRVLCLFVELGGRELYARNDIQLKCLLYCTNETETLTIENT